MSGTPNKRLHEDVGGHSSPLKNPHETKHSHEESTSYPSAGSKLASSVMNEYRASSDMGLDARTPKVARTELREADKSPLVPMYRISSASHDSRSDLPPSSENKFETKESKDSSKDTKSDNRVLKTESRDLYQNVKVDKDSRSEVRGDDNKETKQEREPYGELKSEMKTDKEVYSIGNNQSNWKESKEHYRAKRYSDSTGGNIDTWHASRAGVHGPAEFGMESSTIGKRDQTEAHEAAGENSKSDDKFKDKDRKRKEGKHRESGESNKDRSERRSSNDGRESVRDEKEAENYDRERKDTLKDKDKSKEREKDYCKRDSRDGADKEVSQNEIMDVSGRVIDQSISAEHPIQKDHHGWKSPDKEAKGGKKEKDSDFEGDRCEKRGRCYDKESDDGCVETEGGAEKERDAFSYGVQQRKRMLRPRGSPQMGSRDPQSKSRAPENEGSQGKPEVSIVTYKVGECLQDLIRLWKEYESSQAEKTSASLQSGPTLEIRIPAEHVTATNRQVRGGQLWGSDIYTNDSDLVAVLMHTGYCRPTASPPPSAIQELRAVIRVLPPQDCYFSTLRNSVRSRSWGSAIGCSYRVERCCIIKKEGGAIDLEPCLTHTSTIEPTLAPMIVERTMTTRAAASNALRQQRFVREVTIQYNLCNEPWTKYSISAVADKGLKKPLYTSARLKKGEVLYLETHSCRYELCFSGEKMVKTATAAVANPAEAERSQSHYSNGTNGEKSLSDCENGLIDVFRWSRCKKPLPQKFMCSIGIPLPLENVEVLEDNLEWEDIEWSQTGVYIAGKEYTLARVHFLSPN